MTTPDTSPARNSLVTGGWLTLEPGVPAHGAWVLAVRAPDNFSLNHPSL